MCVSFKLFKHNINSSIKLYLSFRSSQIEADMSYQMNILDDDC